MKTSFFAVATFALFVQSCNPTAQQPQTAAQILNATLPPKAVITSKGNQRRAGELIKVDSKSSVGEANKFTVDMSGVKVPTTGDNSVMLQNAEMLRDQGATVILPTEGEELFDVNGDTVYFASYPGVIRVTLSVASVVEHDDGDKLEIDTAGYVITVLPNEPPEPPSPPDKPTPNPPPSGFGLADKVQGWLATVPTGSRGDAVLIKQVLEANAKLAADGKYRTIVEMQAAIGVGLTAAIKDKLGWAGFGASLMGELQKLQTSKEIETPSDFGKAIAEVAGAM